MRCVFVIFIASRKTVRTRREKPLVDMYFRAREHLVFCYRCAMMNLRCLEFHMVCFIVSNYGFSMVLNRSVQNEHRSSIYSICFCLDSCFSCGSLFLFLGLEATFFKQRDCSCWPVYQGRSEYVFEKRVYALGDFCRCCGDSHIFILATSDLERGDGQLDVEAQFSDDAIVSFRHGAFGAGRYSRHCGCDDCKHEVRRSSDKGE